MHLFIYDEINRDCIIFHVQHHTRRDSRGHYTQRNRLGLGNKKNDLFILIDYNFYELISILKSQSMLFSFDECTAYIAPTSVIVPPIQ